jgi:hypothetical protein
MSGPSVAAQGSRMRRSCGVVRVGIIVTHDFARCFFDYLFTDLFFDVLDNFELLESFFFGSLLKLEILIWFGSLLTAINSSLGTSDTAIFK